MLLHPLAASALQRHAAEDAGGARGWLVGLTQSGEAGEPPQTVVLSAARLAPGCTDLTADLGALQRALRVRSAGADAAA
jgi:hypothetical protein